MIAPVRGVASFEALRRTRCRSRQGPLAIAHVAAPEGHTDAVAAVAFSIGRSVGPAVVRNRLRRRMRAIMRGASPGLAPGLYLVSVAPPAARLTYQELSTTVHTALRSLPEAPPSAAPPARRAQGPEAR